LAEVTVIVAVDELPGLIDAGLAVPAESEKLAGGRVTVRLTVAVCVRLPEVPVTVTAVGPPVVAELLAVRVRMLVVDVLVGLNAAVTPVGSVEVIARLTAPV
jgi:hypothetical protein